MPLLRVTPALRAAARAGLLLISLGLVPTPAVGAAGLEWHQWRGPRGDGSSPDATPPTTWSETRNLRWKVPLAGQGHASPILVGTRVVVQSAVPVGEPFAPIHDKAPGVHDSVPVTHKHQFVVAAHDRATGQLAWSKVLKEEVPHEGGHVTGSLASNSPTTDGERIYAFFGSRGLFCLGLDGTLIWTRDLGRMSTHHAHGEGSSPVLHGDAIFVCWDHEAGSSLHCLDKRTGKTRWKVDRTERTAWATPLIVEQPGRPLLVTSATPRLRAYDTATGEQVWECIGLTDNVVSSPIATRGVVIAGNSYYNQSMVAVHLAGARGDISATTNVAWRLNRLTPYVSSPVVAGNSVYFLRHNQNVLSRFDPIRGRPEGEPIRLDGIRDFIFSSPVAAAGKLFITGRDGTTVVLSEGPGNPVLAVNRLNDSFSATAALGGTQIFLRGERFLYCLEERAAGGPATAQP